MVFLLSKRPLILSWIWLLLCWIPDVVVSFAILRRSNASENSVLRLGMTAKENDKLLWTGDAASLGLFSVVQSIVDPYEPSVGALLGDDNVANYRLDVLANPLLAAGVVIPCWLLAGKLVNAYAVGSSLQTLEDSLGSVLKTYALYLPCVTITLLLVGLATNGTTQIAAPDFTFCAGVISIIGSWRFTLANTIGK